MSNSVGRPGRPQRVMTPAEQARVERNRKVVMIAGVVAVAAVITAAVFWYSGSSKSGTAPSGESYGVLPVRVVGLGSGPARTVSNAPVSGKVARALVIGKRSAAFEVVVYEDFGCADCYTFEEFSRDFLRAAAAKGTAEVEYLPVRTMSDRYSKDALNAFGAALGSAKPADVLRFHDLLFDKQPDATGSSTPGAGGLAAWARGVNVDGAAVSRAVSAGGGGGYAKAADRARRGLGAVSLPAVFVNGKPMSASSLAQMVDKLQTTIGAA